MINEDMTALRNKQFFKEYFQPKLYKKTHDLESVNDLEKISELYDLVIIDRDCTIQDYASKITVPNLENTLQNIGKKSELIIDSSYNQFLQACEKYDSMIPVSMTVLFKESAFPHVLRSDQGVLGVYLYRPDLDLVKDVSSYIARTNKLNYTISLEYKRPDPIILDAIFAVNKAIGRLANDTVKDKVLFVGDTYNDMVFGNLAGIKTAKVTPFKPFSEPLDMVLSRVTDVSLGQLRKLAN